MRSARLSAAVLPLLFACSTPARETLPPKDGDPCENLAYVFFLVADARDRGETKQEQIDKMQASVDNPFAVQREATLRSLLGVVDRVYLRGDESAEEIRTSVRAHCSVDAQGRAVLARPER